MTHDTKLARLGAFARAMGKEASVRLTRMEWKRIAEGLSGLLAGGLCEDDLLMREAFEELESRARRAGDYAPARAAMDQAGEE